MSIIKVNTNILFLVLVFFTLVVYSNFVVSATPYTGSNSQGSTISDSEYDQNKQKYFFGSFTNQGTITDSKSTDGGGLLATGDFTNEGSISITKYSVLIKGKLNNTKYIKVTPSNVADDSGFVVRNSAFNSGSIIVSNNKMEIVNNLTNEGTIITKGLVLDKGATFNSGFITVSEKEADFNKITNTGTIIASGVDDEDENIALHAWDAVVNSGSITVSNGVAYFEGGLTNNGTGTITASGISQSYEGNALYVETGAAVNSGSITVSNGGATFNDKLTNKGTIITSGINSNGHGLGIEKLHNLQQGSIAVTNGAARFTDHATNEGYLKASNTVKLLSSKNISNKNFFETASITIEQKTQSPTKYCIFDNQIESSKAYCKAITNEPYLNIVNNGSFVLQGSSTIGSYTGNKTSELVLTLPAVTPTSLLTVANTATFAADAKIILAASITNTFLKNTTVTVKIVTASSLTIAGSPDDLLYSRVYNQNKSEVKYTAIVPQLQSSSILIEIENATSSIGKAGAKDYLQADLKLVTLNQQKLSSYNSKLIPSLLNNALYNEVITEDKVKKSRGIPTPKPTTPKLTTPKLTTPKLTTPKPAASKPANPKLINLGIEHYKPLDNHFRLTNDIIANYTIELKHGLQAARALSSDNKNHNLWGSVGGYSGAYTGHKWQEMQLCIGNEININTIKCGFTFAYLDTTMSADNQPKTKLHSYHAVAHVMKYIDNICISSGVIYGRTNHKKNSIAESKYTNETSVIITANYKYVVDIFDIDLGINSRLMNINSSRKTADTKPNKLFVSLGTSIKVVTTTKLDDIIAHLSLYSCYDYTGDIGNNNETTRANITTTKLNKHMLFTKLRVHIDYYAWFYNLSFNYSHASKHNIYGCNIVAGYRF